MEDKAKKQRWWQWMSSWSVHGHTVNHLILWTVEEKAEKEVVVSGVCLQVYKMLLSPATIGGMQNGNI